MSALDVPRGRAGRVRIWYLEPAPGACTPADTGHLTAVDPESLRALGYIE